MAVVIMIGIFTTLPVTVNAQEVDFAEDGANLELAEVGFSIRTSYPGTDNYYYVPRSAANPFAVDSNGGNCTWYAWGRVYEASGSYPNLPKGNANTWYGSASCAKGSSPRPGAVICGNAGDYGHVAFVEKVYADGVHFDYSESNWGGARFNYKEYKTTASFGGFQGFLYPFDGGNNEPDYTTTNILSGVYVIHSARDDNMVLDIEGNSTDNDANIQLYKKENTDVQKFRIIRYGDYYCIKSIYNGRWFDLKTPIGDNSNVKLYYENTNDENDWQFIDAGDGYFYIRNRTGYYLDLQGDRAVNNANIQVYHYVGTASQKWRLEDVTKYVNAGGVCKIRSAYNDNMCLDIAGNSKENKANIQLYENTNDDVQKFRIYKDGNFTCFKSLYSNKWLDISLPIENNANVQLWEDNDEEEQKWIFEDAGNGYVYIQSKTGFYLDLQYDQAVNRANIQIYNFVGTDSQRWRIEDLTQHVNVAEDIYTIHSARDDNMVLDIQGNSKENRANIQLFQNVNTDVQRFRVVKYGNYYCIKSVYADKWLDIQTPFNNNSNVQLWESNNSDEQYWIFEDAGNGYVYIRSKLGYYLDLQGDVAENRANIQIYNFVGTKSQKWRLERYTESTEPPTTPPTEPPTNPPTEPPTNPPTTPPTEPPTAAVIKLGDVDGDDEVTIIDATCIQRKLASIATAKFVEAAADADEDGELSILDATAIQRWLAQLPSNVNIGKPSIT